MTAYDDAVLAPVTRRLSRISAQTLKVIPRLVCAEILAAHQVRAVG
jgi:hypothetical protein